MKRLELTSISDNARLPLKKGTLQFLQDANYEIFNVLIRQMLGNTYNPMYPYILWGVEFSEISYGHYSVTDGAIAYNGEIYAVIANTPVGGFTTSNLYLDLTIGHYSSYADPVTLSDNSIVYIHNSRYYTITPTNTGLSLGSTRRIIPTSVNSYFTDQITALNSIEFGTIAWSDTFPDTNYSIQLTLEIISSPVDDHYPQTIFVERASKTNSSIGYCVTGLTVGSVYCVHYTIQRIR